jgi:hypothetical protein
VEVRRTGVRAALLSPQFFLDLTVSARGEIQITVWVPRSQPLRGAVRRPQRVGVEARIWVTQSPWTSRCPV